jgi:nucleoside-diphosphate-sugar epimerase
MNVLVTGSTGFTGPYLLKELKQRGHNVVSLKSNLLNPSDIEDEVKKINPDHVFHLGGLSHLTSNQPDELYKVNTVGSLNLLKALNVYCKNTKSIFLASTAYVYGPTEGKISENSPLLPDSHYAMSKLSMEYLCKANSDRIKVIVFRPFNYTGCGQNMKFLIPKIIKLFKEKQNPIELGNLNVEREFNDVLWFVSVIVSLLEIPNTEGTFNICTGISYKLTKILEILETISDHKPLIKIKSDLVREGEKMKICGDPKKLFNHLNSYNLSPKIPSIESTLIKMFDKQ